MPSGVHIRNKLPVAVIKEMYWLQELTTREIAELIGCCNSSIRDLLKLNGGLRNISDASKVAFKRGRKVLRQPSGAQSLNWRGGRFQTSQGYVFIYSLDHPRATKSKPYVAEHILVWEQVNSKLLPKGWVIHHLNGIRNDNRPENLVALKPSDHIHQAGPYKKRIRELEAKIKLLERALDQNQLIFNIGEN